MWGTSYLFLPSHRLITERATSMGMWGSRPCIRASSLALSSFTLRGPVSRQGPIHLQAAQRAWRAEERPSDQISVITLMSLLFHRHVVSLIHPALLLPAVRVCYQERKPRQTFPV